MKETTYGWYPPARDIMTTYEGQPQRDSYTKECLFKHSKSRYTNQQGVGTPEDPLGNYRWQATPQQVKKYKSMNRSPSPKRPVSNSSRVQQKNSMIDLEIRGHSQARSSSDIKQDVDFSRPKSGYSNANGARPTTPKTPNSSRSNRPLKAWAFRSSDCNNPELQEYLRQYSQKDQRLTPQPPTPLKCTHEYLRRSSPSLSTHKDAVTPSSQRKERVKSAMTYRARIDTPQRAVMSAGPSRFSTDAQDPMTIEPQIDDDQTREEDQESLDRVELESVDAYQPEPDLTYLPPDTYIAPDPAVSISEPATEELGVEFPRDYDEELKKYGWRMQIPGDPLNLKRPCIAKRLPCTSSVSIPKTKPEPPKTRKENWDTYFLNTIPRKPMSFTIHAEWASEVLHAKRMELQKRDGDTYKYKHHNYAFIY